MFERFTTRARQAVVLAQEEARLLNHDHIGTEHLLLGLLGEPEGTAGRVLHQLGLSLPQARADVAAIAAPGERAQTGHIPFTKPAKKTLELSLREALTLGHNYIGTEHVLLGLIRQGDGVAMHVLNQRGATADRIRPLVMLALETTAATNDTGTSIAPRRTPGASAVISVAEQLAGAAPVGSQHLLEAMALVDDSLAASTLNALGIDADTLAAKIDELGTEGTADISPDDIAARQMELRLGDDEVTIVLRDDAAVALARTLTAATGNPLRGDGPGGNPLVGIWRANMLALQQLVERVEPSDNDNDDQTSRATAVRNAIRNRLRRPS